MAVEQDTGGPSPKSEKRSSAVSQGGKRSSAVSSGEKRSSAVSDVDAEGKRASPSSPASTGGREQRRSAFMSLLQEAEERANKSFAEAGVDVPSPKTQSRPGKGIKKNRSDVTSHSQGTSTPRAGKEMGRVKSDGTGAAEWPPSPTGGVFGPSSPTGGVLGPSAPAVGVLSPSGATAVPNSLDPQGGKGRGYTRNSRSSRSSRKSGNARSPSGTVVQAGSADGLIPAIVLRSETAMTTESSEGPPPAGWFGDAQPPQDDSDILGKLDRSSTDTMARKGTPPQTNGEDSTPGGAKNVPNRLQQSDQKRFVRSRNSQKKAQDKNLTPGGGGGLAAGDQNNADSGTPSTKTSKSAPLLNEVELQSIHDGGSTHSMPRANSDTRRVGRVGTSRSIISRTSNRSDVSRMSGFDRSAVHALDDGDALNLSTPSAMSMAERRQTLNDFSSGKLRQEKTHADTIVMINSPQTRARKLAVSPLWLTVQIFTLLFEFGILIYLIATGHIWCFATECVALSRGEFIAYATSAVVASAVILFDICLRWYGFRDVFWKKFWNKVNLVLVIITTVVTVAAASFARKDNIMPWISVRLLHVLMFPWLLRTKTKFRALRRITGENKKRFVVPEEDFDLDLAYVTKDLIAMSVPAQGTCVQMYRNPIHEVIRFFNRYHPDSFHIINLCPEVPYDSDLFGNNSRTGETNVHAFNVQDHTPPMLEDFHTALEVCRKWRMVDEENMMAVHCRGGKGRTGSICCAWLIYMDEADDAEDALTFFALGRTDTLQMSSTKVQGVETPSQVRFVHYLQTAMMNGDEPIRFPDPLPLSNFLSGDAGLRLQRLEVDHFFEASYIKEIRGAGDGCRKRVPCLKQKAAEDPSFVAAVHVQRKCEGENNTLERDMNRAPFKIAYWSQPVKVVDQFASFDLGDFEIYGDARVTIFKDTEELEEVRKADASGERVLAGTEPGCICYFIFHSRFHLEDKSLSLIPSQVDKASKKAKKYQQDGRLELFFEKCDVV